MLFDVNEQFRKAQVLIQKQDATREELDFAEDILNALLNYEPRNLRLLFGLGVVFMRKQYTALSILTYETLIKVAGDSPIAVSAWMNLGVLHNNEGRKEQAMNCYAMAEKNMPLDEEIHPDLREDHRQLKRDMVINRACNYVASGEPQVADKMLGEVMANWPECEEAKWNRGLALLEQGIYGEGFDLYERSKKRNIRSYPGEPPEWNGEKNCTVMVYGEQGIGDEIMFASVIPDLMRDCRVVMDAHLRLADMFRRSFEIPVYGTREFNALLWQHPEKVDYKISIGSLCRFYRRKVSEFPGTPYLIADSKLKKRYKNKLAELGDKPCIGISWRGGSKSTNKNIRNIQLKALMPLFQSIDANWISLQYQPTSARAVAEFEAETGIKIYHWKEAIDDYDMTAALVKNLDLVISVPQSVVHLAGSLGVDTWQLTPKKAMWQMGVYGQDMPWYKCVRSIWQDDSCTWDSVIQQTAKELQEWNLSRTNIAA